MLEILEINRPADAISLQVADLLPIFNRYNKPTEMYVETIEAYPQDDEIPKYKDLPIIDITDGIDSYKYMWSERNAS